MKNLLDLEPDSGSCTCMLHVLFLPLCKNGDSVIPVHVQFYDVRKGKMSIVFSHYKDELRVGMLSRSPPQTYMYRILPSKRPSPCKRSPPIFDDPMVRVYMRYTYKWLLRVNTHPRFLAREFQAPMGAYSGDYGIFNVQ